MAEKKTEERAETFIEKVISIQRDLKAPKGQYNPFGKFKYRSAEDILNSVKPLLVSKGLLLTIEDEIVLIGARYYVQATATITDGEKSITNTAFAREDDVMKGMAGSQITGASSSYARKYALNGLFCIDDTKDADALNDGTIHDVYSQINEAKSRQELVAIWNANMNMQSDAKFVEAFQVACKKYPKQ